MDDKNLFQKFNEEEKLLLPNATVSFDSIPWSKHSAFEGVELKHIITSEKTNGQFSFHLVRIAPKKKIGNHIHEKQLETHEVIAGGRPTCFSNCLIKWLWSQNPVVKATSVIVSAWCSKRCAFRIRFCI